MADEFNARMFSYYGADRPLTPTLDGLAKGGTLFSNAYCNSPICVPSRAAFATGRYVHQTANWDNAHPYDGSIPGWGHALIAAGHEVVSIGKLHYRRVGDPNGFSTEIMPMHVANGVGDVLGSVRGRAGGGGGWVARDVGRGDTDYSRYDQDITRAAVDWLRARAAAVSPKPWVLFVSFVCPHPPFMAPAAFYDLYERDRLPWPRLRDAGERADHPFIRGLLDANDPERHFDEDSVYEAVAAYYGLCSFIDDNVRQILEAVKTFTGSAEPRVVFTSDHGESLGRRGLWGKRSFYEESVAVPLIMAGADVPAGRVCATPVSLVDFHPTVLEAAGEPELCDPALPGRSLFGLAGSDDPERMVLSEYHASGAIAAGFMLRRGRYKYIHYVGLEPQLFDLEDDPDELWDLAASPAFRPLRDELERTLRTLVDPEAVDQRARADQRAMVERHGGVEAVLKRGTFGNSPVPGAKPKYMSPTS